jgi:hypothetical protein
MGKRIDLTGQTIGKWFVIEYIGGEYCKWLCRCACGSIRPVNGQNLRRGWTLSCKQCNYRELVGQTFGELTVIAAAGQNAHGDYMMDCLCACGSQNAVTASMLLSGHKKSCGCLKRRSGALHKNWKGYGEIPSGRWRAIQSNAEARSHAFFLTIQAAWDLFVTQGARCALSGVVISFADGTASLDRTDSSRGYEPGNVQWVHKTVNLMKNVIPQDEFIAWCRSVSEHSQTASVTWQPAKKSPC